MLRHQHKRNRKKGWLRGGLSAVLSAGMLMMIAGCRSSEVPASHEAEDAPVGVLTLAADDALGPVVLALKQAFEYEHPGILLSVSFGQGTDLTDRMKYGQAWDVLLTEAGEDVSRLERDGTALSVQAQMEDPMVLAAAPERSGDIRDFQEMTDQLKAGDRSLAMEQKGEEMRLALEHLLQSYGCSLSALGNTGRIWFCVDGASCADTVLRGEADCGILCRSEALDTSLVILDTAERSRYEPLVYSSVILTDSLHPDGARMFLDYMTGDTGRQILKEYGYESLAP